MARAFVSYVRENSKTVDRLVDELRRGGVTIWLDRDSIAPGEPWEGAIQKAILKGGFFLACFSREYHTRHATYMNEELEVAFKTVIQKRFSEPWLIPILLNSCEVPNYRICEEYTLRSLQCVDLSKDWHEGMRQLLNLIEPSHSFGHVRRQSQEYAPVLGNCVSVPLVALDFGTSFSAMSVFSKEHGWKAIPDENGRTLIPSVITFADNWDYYIGWDAVAAGVHCPQRSVANVKRLLGTEKSVAVEHKRFDPETLASLIIRFLKDNAEQFIGAPISKVLMAVPANFSSRQSAALARACARAGLSVERLIGEPNAAGLVALEWLDQHRKATASVQESLMLVIDIGGGTTDVSVIQLPPAHEKERVVEVILIAGDNELGGMDYDDALFRFIKARDVEPKIAAGLSWTQVDDRRLQQEICRAKTVLSASPTVTITLGEMEFATGLNLVQCEITRTDFQAAVQALDVRVERLIAQVLSAVKTTWHWKYFGPLAAVMLAGQGAKIFTVSQILKRAFPNTPIVGEYQEQAVVRGLGAYSGVLGGARKDLLLLDILHHAILLRCLDPSPSDKQIDVIISSDTNNNVKLLELLRANRIIPRREVFKAKITGRGNVQLDFIENGAPDQHAPLLSLTVDAAHCTGELYVVIDADANKTVVVWVYSQAIELIQEQQLTNPFLEVHPVSRQEARDALIRVIKKGR
jgi:molecular chaperone DnaK